MSIVQRVRSWGIWPFLTNAAVVVVIAGTLAIEAAKEGLLWKR